MRHFVFIIAFLIPIFSFSQELDCNVKVNSDRLQGTNKQVFSTLEESLNDFMNNTIWTNYVYEPQERIECNLQIDITEQISTSEFKGTIQLQARRPIFGSSYNSVILNYVDNDVQFTYQEFDAIEITENTFVSNLSSLLSFYAYLMIGLDNDTYSLKGGDDAFRQAEKIVNSAQSSSYDGWQSSDSQKRKNRYWLVNNLLDSEYSPLRSFYYSYHRQGLDLMEKSVEKGRNGTTEAILTLDNFSNNKPDPFTYLLTVIIEAKADEFVNIYMGSSQTEKQKIKNILIEIDPAGSRKYNEIDQ
jgi:hypothetical protein